MQHTQELAQLNAVALRLFQKRQYISAARVCDTAAELANGLVPQILAQAAMCYRHAQDFELALDRITQYLELVPTDYAAVQEQAFYLRWLGQYQESERTVSSNLPDSAGRNLSLGWHAMQHGKFQKSIELTEHGRRGSYWSAQRIYPTIPRCQNNDILNKRILVCGEGGCGDEIIFSRWLPDLKNIAQYVEYYTDNGLSNVFARQFGVTPITDPSKTTCDYYLPAMSLAAAIRAHAPGNRQYLSANTDYLTKWQARLADIKKPLILINANGDLLHPEHKLRSLSWSLMAESFVDQGQLVSVQPTPSDVMPDGVLDLSTEITSWEDTLAILALSDVSITMCTAIAHASAALGRNTVVLTTPCDYFTWCATPSGQMSSWYEHAWVIRQQQIGKWQQEIAHAKELVANILNNSKDI